MGRAAPRTRVLMTGVRKGGDTDYHFKIFGNASSAFPPLIVKMSLLEMQQWLRQLRDARERAQQDIRPRLRVIS